MKLKPVHKTAGATTASGEGKILYFKSTMKPGETSRKPGKDSMGMDMVPVYADEAAAANSSAIAIDPATIQMMNIHTTEITRGPLRKTIRTVGTIDYNETALADVTTKFKGWIEKLNVDATGQLVHRGEPLFEIYSPELYSAEAEYLLAVIREPPTTRAMPLRETAAEQTEILRYLGRADRRAGKSATSRARRCRCSRRWMAS